MARFSTGLRNAVAAQYGLGTMMNRGLVRVFGGSAPASPDDPPGTPELARITTEGRVFVPDSDPNEAGLMLQLVSPGALVNDGDWVLKGTGNGQLSWWRWTWKWTDDDLPSDYYPRVDGRVGEELKVSNAVVTPSTIFGIEEFIIQLLMGT